MTDPDDRKTLEMFEHDEKSEETTEGNVVDITEILDEQHLAREHGLVKTTAYVRDPAKAKKKSGSAERMAKLREREKEKGIAQLKVPAQVADEVKAVGSFEAWLEAREKHEKTQIVEVVVEKRVEVPVEVVREVEKLVEVPLKLSQEERECLDAGRELREFFQRGGFRARLLAWLIK